MSAPTVVVASVGCEGSVQGTLSEDDHVILALAANGTNQPFNVGPLPRGSRCREHLFDPHGFDSVDEFVSKDPISITQETSWRALPRKGLPQLLDRPLRCRMHRHGEVNDSSALMRQDKKHIEDLKPDSRHGEEVDGNHACDVIVKECSPGLRWRLPIPEHVLGDGWLTDLDSKFQQLAVNPRCAPPWIVTAHRADQVPDLRR